MKSIPHLIPVVFLILQENCLGVKLPHGLASNAGCEIFTSDGVIDISSLGNTDGTPRFKDVRAIRDAWYYSYNPCYPFIEGTCKGASICQTNTFGSYFQAGDVNTAEQSQDAGKLAIHYTSQSKDMNRESWVVLTCNPSAVIPSFVATGDTSMGKYHFELISMCACPNVCASSWSYDVSISISAGTILIIVFLVVVVVYIVGGIVFNKMRRQATGVEMMPNVDFWRGFPGLVKDGFVFTFTKMPCCSSARGYTSFK